MRRLAARGMQLGHGAVHRPRRVLWVGLLVALLAGLAATQLTPASPQGLLARDGSDVGAATIGQERAFGAEPVVVVLRGDVLDATLAEGNVERLLALERKLAKVPGVQSVIGPATFVDSSVQQMYKVVEEEFGPAAERADRAAKQAAAEARKDPRFTPEEATQVGEQARIKALGPLATQYQDLFVRFGSVGFPSLTNRSFVAQLVLGAGAEPKERFRWLFPDRGHALVIVRPRAGLGDEATRRLGREVRAAVGAAALTGVSTQVAGAPLVIAEATSSVAGELVRLLPVVVLAMALVLLLGLGVRNRAVHLLVPAGGAVLLTAGLSWPLGLGFTAATLAALPVVVGLAVDYAVQLQARYWGERDDGHAPRDAAVRALQRIGPTLVLAGAAMSIGFLALVLSPVPLVGRLGLTLALGVLCSLVCVLLLTGPLMVARDRPGADAPRLRVPAPTLRPRVRFAALSVAIGLTLAGLVLSGGTAIESDLRELADNDMRELVALEEVQEEIGTGGQIRVAVTARNVTSRAALEWMGEAEPEILALDPAIRPGPNLANILTSGGRELPEAEAIPKLLELVPATFVSAILTAERDRAELSFGVPISSAAEQAELIARMQDVLEGAPAGVTAQVAGLQALSGASVEGLQDERPWLLLLAALLIVGLLYLARRDVHRAVIPVLPALLAAGSATVVIEALDLELSPLSAGLDPLVLAVGVEFGLLLEARYREERRRGLVPSAAARRCAELVGAPVVVAAATVGLGFLVLVLSRLPVLQQFGLVAALELALAVLAALLLVPALCAASDRSRGVCDEPSAGTGDPAVPPPPPRPRESVA